MGEVARSELYCPTCEKTFLEGERCPADNTRLVKLAGVVDKLIGRELDGRYTIVEKLGQGGMGAVYRGTQHSVGRDVAIKLVKPGLITDGMVIKRFLREAKLASRLSHPNAISVMEFGQTDDGLFYLVMELVAGRTLEQVLEAERVLSPQRVVRIGAQICDALEAAHDLQIVHRDLKPQNVMVLAKGRDIVKVLDFGIAKSLTPEPGNTTLTNAGSVLGTPAFMPPELVTEATVDARTDLYSLGCVLYLCATGQLPFTAGTAHEVMVLHATERPPLAKGVPPKLAAVLDKLLEKEPARRYQTAAETREALEAALGDAPAATAEPSAADSLRTMLGWAGDSATGNTPRPRIATPAAGVRPVTPPAGTRTAGARPVTPAVGVARTATPASGVPVVVVAPVRAIVDDEVEAPTMIATPAKPIVIAKPTSTLASKLLWILGGAVTIGMIVLAIVVVVTSGGSGDPPPVKDEAPAAKPLPAKAPVAQPPPRVEPPTPPPETKPEVVKPEAPLSKPKKRPATPPAKREEPVKRPVIRNPGLGGH
jgi:hypothetical protein